MIRIIKHGTKRNAEKEYQFKCDKCGCEWIADNQHISRYVGGMGHIFVSSQCPDCDTILSREQKVSELS